MPSPNLRQATVLLAHGSSDANWLKPFEQLTSSIRQSVGATARIELAYMELAEPSLESVTTQLSDEGYGVIEVLPLFFAAGRHLRKDVPMQLNALSKEHMVRMTLKQPVGLEPEVAGAISNVVLRSLQANSEG